MGAGNAIRIITEYKKAKKRFFERNSSFKYFKNIDEQRKNEIRQNANEWLEDCNKIIFPEIILCLLINLNNPNINSRISAHNKKTESRFFDFNDSDEELMFYMFVIDPELKLLQINYEENKTENIKKRYSEEFGIDMDIRLLKLELYYNKKFPTIIDEFDMSKTKKI